MTSTPNIYLPTGVRPLGKKHRSSQIWQYSWGWTWSRLWSACWGPRCTLITIKKLSSTQAVSKISSPLLHLEADLKKKQKNTYVPLLYQLTCSFIFIREHIINRAHSWLGFRDFHREVQSVINLGSTIGNPWAASHTLSTISSCNEYI